MSTEIKINKLRQQLNTALAQRALLDEQIVSLRNIIQGINLGVELQKELDKEDSD